MIASRAMIGRRVSSISPNLFRQRPDFGTVTTEEWLPGTLSLLSSLPIVAAESSLRPHGRQQLHSIGGTRWYSSTRPILDEDKDGTTEGENMSADGGDGDGGGEAVAVQKDTSKQQEKHRLRQIALEYGQQRASYRRQVNQLRKAYLDEYLKHKAEDEAQRETERAAVTRRRLERQRAKNERSVENARRQKELRRQAHLAFQDHLRVQQERREQHKDLMKQARQLVIDELEEECHLWMTTPEEVEAAFSPEAEQLLWARPQGVLGVPNPSPDAHFWTYEGHTWDMSKTYKTQSQLLLEEIEQEAYMETNVDPNVWTPERIAEREELERKAKLRTNVRLEGRKNLLKRQLDYLDQDQETAEDEPPKPMPVPSLGVLANSQAQEKEGAELLLRDPTKFFVFDAATNTGTGAGYDSNDDKANASAYAGPSLGTPVDIRDPLRTGQPQGRVFPVGVGKLPKPDMRTEKDKKRQEREERLWAAAQAQSKGDGASDDMDLVAEEDRDIGEAIDYDANDDWDSDDEEWAKGLDPDQDEDILNVPREYRYREEDIDFVIEKLENKAQAMQSHVQNTIQTMEQEARSRLDRAVEETAAVAAAATTTEVNDETNSRASSPSPFFDEATVQKLQSVGADVDKYERLMSSLTREQLLSLFALEAQRRDSGVEASTATSAEASTKVFEVIPDLTEEQVVGLTELESFLQVAEKSGGASAASMNPSE